MTVSDLINELKGIDPATLVVLELPNGFVEPLLDYMSDLETIVIKDSGEVAYDPSRDS